MAILVIKDYNIPADYGFKNQFSIVRIYKVAGDTKEDKTDSFPKSMPHQYFENDEHATRYLNDVMPEIKDEEIIFQSVGGSSITVGTLIEMLKVQDPDSEVYFGGLDFYRVKRRGDDIVQIEFNQTIYKDEDGTVHITN